MTKRKVILEIVLMSVLVISCNDFNPKIAEPTFSTGAHQQELIAAEANLDLLARSMARVLNDAAVKDVLHFKIEVAESREKVLDFSDLITRTVGADGRTIAQKMVATGGLMKSGSGGFLTEEELVEMVDSFQPMVDIYFPVPEHRERWLKNKGELLVAYTSLTLDDTEWETIPAYTLKGQLRYLDAKTVPEEPVLVISVCEHHGNHSLPNAPLGCPPECGGGGGGGNSEPTWRIYVTDFRLMDDHEPWTAGDLEIYVRVRHPWNSNNNNAWRRMDFPEVNDERLYDESSYNWLPKAIYSEPQSTGGYDPNIPTDVEVWEDDGGLTFGDDQLEDIWHFNAPNGPITNFDHSQSSTYNGRDWYYGDNGDADLRMYGILENF